MDIEILFKGAAGRLAIGAILSQSPAMAAAAREIAEREMWLMQCAALGATEADALKHESIILALAYASTNHNSAVANEGRSYYKARLLRGMPPPTADVGAWLDGFIGWSWLGTLDLTDLDAEQLGIFLSVKHKHYHWYDLARKLWAAAE